MKNVGTFIIEHRVLVLCFASFSFFWNNFLPIVVCIFFYWVWSTCNSKNQFHFSIALEDIEQCGLQARIIYWQVEYFRPGVFVVFFFFLIKSLRNFASTYRTTIFVSWTRWKTFIWYFWDFFWYFWDFSDILNFLWMFLNSFRGYWGNVPHEKTFSHIL